MTAIFALQRSTHKALDTISRQDAIDVVKHAWAKGLEPTQYIEELPSAQPEIIRCKDCRFVWRSAEGGLWWCNRLSGWFPVAEVVENDFCSHAERKENR